MKVGRGKRTAKKVTELSPWGALVTGVSFSPIVNRSLSLYMEHGKRELISTEVLQVVQPRSCVQSYSQERIQGMQPE